MKVCIKSLTLFLFAMSVSTAPLKICPSNPRYFMDSNGVAIYLGGSYPFTFFMDIGPTDPPTFNYPPLANWKEYLNVIEKHGHNFIRGWRWELFKYSYGQTRYSHPHPWKRTGPGQAKDGKPKFDLEQFDEEYFNRLRERAIEAGKRGIYLSVMLFEGHGPNQSNSPLKWEGHPFHPDNNINKLNIEHSHLHTLSNQTLVALQKKYVKKVVEHLNDLDNIIYEIGNEIPTHSTQFQNAMINYIKEVESSLPKQHPVGMTFQYHDGNDEILYNSSADWISPRSLPEVTNGKKVIIWDNDHFDPNGNNEMWPWQAFFAGAHFIDLEDFGGNFNRELHKTIGAAVKFGRLCNLANLHPAKSLSSTGMCLADSAGCEYAVFQQNNGPFTVNLSRSKAKELHVQWMDARSGTLQEGAPITPSSTFTFTPPGAGWWALRIYEKKQTATTAHLKKCIIHGLKPNNILFDLKGKKVGANYSQSMLVIIKNDSDESSLLSKKIVIHNRISRSHTGITRDIRYAVF